MFLASYSIAERIIKYNKMVHFSAASLIRIGFLLVLVCWTHGSTGVSFSLEEEFSLIKENYIQMKAAVKSLEEKDVQTQERITELEAKVKEQDLLLFDLLQEKNNERMRSNSYSVPITTNHSAMTINGLPSSCEDLSLIGHTLNGFYSVMGSAMMESVYCDFTKLPSDAEFEKWIGFVDVKSTPVFFYAQRYTPFNATRTPIPFDLAVVNEGNAMDLESGIFTAPRTGMYYFSFTGLAFLPSSTSSPLGYFGVFLYLNGVLFGAGRVDEANSVAIDQLIPLSLQWTLKLIKGDRLWVEIAFYSPGVLLGDSIAHYTHFSGFMLQEEIAASL